MDTDVILIGDAIQTDQCLVLTEIKESQVRNCIVVKLTNRISLSLYSTCVNEGWLMSENVNILVEKTRRQ